MTDNNSYECIVVESIAIFGDCPVRAWCDLCGDRWSVAEADVIQLEQWMDVHAHPQLAFWEAAS